MTCPAGEPSSHVTRMTSKVGAIKVYDEQMIPSCLTAHGIMGEEERFMNGQVGVVYSKQEGLPAS